MSFRQIAVSSFLSRVLCGGGLGKRAAVASAFAAFLTVKARMWVLPA